MWEMAKFLGGWIRSHFPTDSSLAVSPHLSQGEDSTYSPPQYLRELNDVLRDLCAKKLLSVVRDGWALLLKTPHLHANLFLADIVRLTTKVYQGEVEVDRDVRDVLCCGSSLDALLLSTSQTCLSQEFAEPALRLLEASLRASPGHALAISSKSLAASLFNAVALRSAKECVDIIEHCFLNFHDQEWIDIFNKLGHQRHIAVRPNALMSLIREIYIFLCRKKGTVDISYLNALLNSAIFYCSDADCQEVLTWFDANRALPNSDTFQITIKRACREVDAVWIMSLLQEAQERGFKFDLNGYRYALEGLLKAKDWDSANKVASMMLSQNITELNPAFKYTMCALLTSCDKEKLLSLVQLLQKQTAHQESQRIVSHEIKDEMNDDDLLAPNDFKVLFARCKTAEEVIALCASLQPRASQRDEPSLINAKALLRLQEMKAFDEADRMVENVHEYAKDMHSSSYLTPVVLNYLIKRIEMEAVTDKAGTENERKTINGGEKGSGALSAESVRLWNILCAYLAEEQSKNRVMRSYLFSNIPHVALTVRQPLFAMQLCRILFRNGFCVDDDCLQSFMDNLLVACNANQVVPVLCLERNASSNALEVAVRNVSRENVRDRDVALSPLSSPSPSPDILLELWKNLRVLLILRARFSEGRVKLAERCAGIVCCFVSGRAPQYALQAVDLMRARGAFADQPQTLPPTPLLLNAIVILYKRYYHISGEEKKNGIDFSLERLREIVRWYYENAQQHLKKDFHSEMFKNLRDFYIRIGRTDLCEELKL